MVPSYCKNLPYNSTTLSKLRVPPISPSKLNLPSTTTSKAITLSNTNFSKAGLLDLWFSSLSDPTDDSEPISGPLPVHSLLLSTKELFKLFMWTYMEMAKNQIQL